MIKKIGLMLCLILSLQGCVFAIGGAIGVAGTTVIYDQRDIKQTFKDEQISHAVSQKLGADTAIAQQCHIVISTYRGTVLLTGQAPSAELRRSVIEITKTVPDVLRIYNEITVEGPSSSITRASDAWITTKVKTFLLAAKGLKSGQFKVITENGTVFLMGLVTQAQANLAVAAARKVGGVQKVVKVFTYVRPTPETPEVVGDETTQSGTI